MLLFSIYYLFFYGLAEILESLDSRFEKRTFIFVHFFNVDILSHNIFVDGNNTKNPNIQLRSFSRKKRIFENPKILLILLIIVHFDLGLF
jgi:hypothetical protein